MFHFSKQSIFIWISLTILIYFSELFPVSSLPLGIFSSSSDTSFRSNFNHGLLFVIVQLLSWVCLLVTSWTAARQAILCLTISWSVLELMPVKLMMPSNHLILCCPLLLLLSIFSSIKVFSNELALWISWPKYWSFSFSISSPNKYSELISFRMALVYGVSLPPCA